MACSGESDGDGFTPIESSMADEAIISSSI